MTDLEKIENLIEKTDIITKYKKEFLMIKENIVNDKKNQTNVNNVEYADMKGLFNRICETLFEKHISYPFYFAGEYKKLKEELANLSMPYEIRSLKPLMIKIEKIKNKDLTAHEKIVINQIEKINQDLIPVMNILEWAKQSNQEYKINQKNHREIKEVEKNEMAQVREVLLTSALTQQDVTMFLKNDLLDKLSDMKIKNFDANEYIKKITSHKEVLKTFNFLKEKMIHIHQEIKQSEMKNIQSILNDYIEKSKMKNISDPSDFMHPIEVMKLSSLIVYEGRDANKIKQYSVVKNQDEMIESLSQEYATELVNRYISKTVSKVAYCLSKRDDLADFKIINLKASPYIEGTIEFEFKDNSTFQLTSGIVLSYSKYNKPFYKYPSIFQHVHLNVEGHLIKMPEPSEEKIDKIFIKKDLNQQQLKEIFPQIEQKKIKP